MRSIGRYVQLGLVVVLAGCGADQGSAGADQGSQIADPGPARESARKHTRVVLHGSAFGRMLFDSKRQAIYVFQRDRRNKTNCYGECAEAWPPVFTEGRPTAGKGVSASRLGTIRRRDGRRQVTYAGRPLYYYAHEGPGEVECHNVYLNGGFWWAIGPDGKRLR
jgi:predicted lipoprotein with Yx(FWY)xxD motif